MAPSVKSGTINTSAGKVIRVRWEALDWHDVQLGAEG